MKHVLLASAAALALLAAPFALAQYPETTPAAPPSYTTPQTAPGYTTPAPTYVDPAAPSATAPMPSTTAEPYVAPSTAAPSAAYDTPNVAAAQPGDTTAEADASVDTQSAETAPDYQSAETAPSDQSAEADTAQTYAASADMAALEGHARDAGMASLPMNAADVCAPRSVDFQQTRLTNDARHQLVNAVDRASVCEMQSVTIKASENRANAVRRELVAAGVDEGMITVEPASGALEVDMAFNGVAASSEQYAAMWNGGPTLASADTGALDNTAPGYVPGEPATSNQGYAPTTYQPDATAPGATESTDEIYDPTTTL